MPSPLSSVLPAPDEKSRTVRSMFDRIAPRYELVNRLMTFGLDARWRTRTIRSLGLPTHSLVLDVACGTGDLSRTCVAQQLRPVGVDLSFGMLAAAHDSGPLVHADATQLPVATASVDISAVADARREALLAHATQVDPNSRFWFGLPPEVISSGSPTQSL